MNAEEPADLVIAAADEMMSDYGAESPEAVERIALELQGNLAVGTLVDDAFAKQLLQELRRRAVRMRRGQWGAVGELSRTQH